MIKQHPVPNLLLIIVDTAPNDSQYFANELLNDLNVDIDENTKVLIRHFEKATNIDDVIAYTIGLTYPLSEELGCELDVDSTILQNFKMQFTSYAISGYLAYLYKPGVRD